MTTKLYNLVLLLILLTLVGCSSIEKIEQPLISDFATLSNENTIGQTYVARYDGLDGFLIYVEPEPRAQGVVHLQLSEGPEENKVLRTSTINLSDVSYPGYIHFQFPPVKDSTQKYYYVRLQPVMEGASNLRVGTSSGDSYLNGALYQNQIPQDAQLAFNLSYNPIRVSSGLLQEGLTWILWIEEGGSALQDQSAEEGCVDEVAVADIGIERVVLGEHFGIRCDDLAQDVAHHGPCFPSWNTTPLEEDPHVVSFRLAPFDVG